MTRREELLANSVNAVCDALVAQSRREMAEARSVASARPVGEVRLDIDFFSPAERGKPVEDYDFHDASGRHWKGFGARWCVIKVRWTGTDWKRVRRISGPLQFTPALTRCTEECARLGLETA